jgi:hypothetical protein
MLAARVAAGWSLGGRGWEFRPCLARQASPRPQQPLSRRHARTAPSQVALPTPRKRLPSVAAMLGLSLALASALAGNADADSAVSLASASASLSSLYLSLSSLSLSSLSLSSLSLSAPLAPPPPAVECAWRWRGCVALGEAPSGSCAFEFAPAPKCVPK